MKKIPILEAYVPMLALITTIIIITLALALKVYLTPTHGNSQAIDKNSSLKTNIDLEAIKPVEEITVPTSSDDRIIKL